MVKNKIVIMPEYAILQITRKEQKYDVLIDLEDVEKVKERNWHIHHSSSNIYARACVNGRRVQLHRYLLGYDGPDTIDHINRNTLDNRKANLRVVTMATNLQNKNGLRIQRMKNTWYVDLTFYGHRYKLYGFKTQQDAINARDNLIKELKAQESALAQEFYSRIPVRNVYPRPNGKWTAYISKHGKVINLGTFTSKERAIEARDRAEANKGR